jgi:hypothetical protein
MESILKNQLDRLPPAGDPPLQTAVDHDNIRGADYFDFPPEAEPPVISTSVRREVWTSRWSGRCCTTRTGYAAISIFSWWGRPGFGKTFLARAFGQKACRDGFTAYFATAAQLFRDLELARADGSYAKKLRALGQVDALIVDDWAMAPIEPGSLT